MAAAYRAITRTRPTAVRPALAVFPSKTMPVAAVASYSMNRRNTVRSRLFHAKPVFYIQPSAQTPPTDTSNPVIGTMAQSTSPSGQNQNDTGIGAEHAAFLGEADSNDGHETFRDNYAAPHEAVDSTNAAFLGEADSNDSFEVQKNMEGQPLPTLDAKNAAYLGEADSDDAFEADIIQNPQAHEHHIDSEDTKNAAFLGEG